MDTTTYPVSLPKLLERLGALSGPDRELDFWCWWYGASTESKKANPGPPPEDYAARNIKRNDSPLYTASLDAARTMILPEHSFGGLSQVSPTDWIMLIFSRTDSHARWEGEARTAELAVCIAALRARESAA